MKKLFLIIFISLCFLTSLAEAVASEKNNDNCLVCHEVEKPSNAHKSVSCSSCHIDSKNGLSAGKFEFGAEGCLSCHENYKNMLASPMYLRTDEKQFVHESYGTKDSAFFDKNCSSCHVDSCLSCHSGASFHEIEKPSTNKCISCHNDYYIGLEYTGLGIKDDHERYGRGIEHEGKFYAKMLPDVHHEKNMDCSACHSMKSLSDGIDKVASCTDCHDVSANSSVEHSISEHMEKMECYTCHSSWLSQEYGTFWIRFSDSTYSDFFRWVKTPNDEYAASSHTKEYSSFPIGINLRGKYSPIRPQFISFFTYVKKDQVVGKENEMLSGKFKAVFPHTIRREVVTCDSCHKSNKRLMRETSEERIFDLKKDGLEIESFFNHKDFSVSNGRFINDDEYEKITADSMRYKKLYIKKWNEIIKAINLK